VLCSVSDSETLNADPDPALLTIVDPDPIPNADPDPGSQSNADPMRIRNTGAKDPKRARKNLQNFLQHYSKLPVPVLMRFSIQLEHSQSTGTVPVPSILN
jgi:hypothetical protein